MQTSFSPSCSDLFGISEQSYVQMKLTLDSKWPRLGSDFPRHNGHVMSRLCPIKLANLHDSTITSLLLRPVVSVMLRWKSQIWSSQINGKSSVLASDIWLVVSWMEISNSTVTENAWYHPEKHCRWQNQSKWHNDMDSYHQTSDLVKGPLQMLLQTTTVAVSFANAH